jgi:hypothetical protein
LKTHRGPTAVPDSDLVDYSRCPRPVGDAWSQGFIQNRAAHSLGRCPASDTPSTRCKWLLFTTFLGCGFRWCLPRLLVPQHGPAADQQLASQRDDGLLAGGGNGPAIRAVGESRRTPASGKRSRLGHSQASRKDCHDQTPPAAGTPSKCETQRRSRSAATRPAVVTMLASEYRWKVFPASHGRGSANAERRPWHTEGSTMAQEHVTPGGHTNGRPTCRSLSGVPLAGSDKRLPCGRR